ncbi:formate dehydrogenase subunit gamma [Breoghania sp.]|uniref:formate dehydrogenase subunit gamma n=1 Tax=Breoghania sp. TaxID=2065378 RepID=UPI0029CA6B5F|nr:formate dehydrogenase subunit gamma [Breoghania sp.]
MGRDYSKEGWSRHGGRRFADVLCARLAGLAMAFLLAAFAVTFVPGVGVSSALAQPVGAPELRQNPVDGHVPGDALGTKSDADLWRAIRNGSAEGKVSIPDKKAATLIQSEGDNWRAFRNGPLSTYGVWAMLGMVIVVALFFAIRGRIRIENGRSGKTITRFTFIERTGHWLAASSFIVMALTGLNLLYGRYVLEPVIGKEAFAAITHVGKLMHNYMAFAFMTGLTVLFVMWVKYNIPRYIDLIWLMKGGGLFTKGLHVDARKFNAGQKLIFWSVMLAGLSASISGWSMIFPFTTHLFSATFEVVNAIFGTSLPTGLAPIHEQQLAQLWHAIIAIALICIIIAHVYIGSLGMEGAFEAMGTGEVDLNWAKEHHNLWVKEVEEAQAREAEEARKETAEARA